MSALNPYAFKVVLVEGTQRRTLKYTFTYLEAEAQAQYLNEYRGNGCGRPIDHIYEVEKS